MGQSMPAVSPTTTAPGLVLEALGFNQVAFGKAEITGPDGKTHFVWVPIRPTGFNRLLPFYRTEAQAQKFASEPFNIDVDKVQSIKVNGLYQEHMVLKGKRKHLLATRLVNGPVELFNYTEIDQTAPVVGMAGGALGGPGLGSIPNRQWFLRRAGGELVKVERLDFVPQMTAYFQDAPEVVAALARGQLHYRDMVQLVEGYNEFRTRPAAN